MHISHHANISPWLLDIAFHSFFFFFHFYNFFSSHSDILCVCINVFFFLRFFTFYSVLRVNATHEKRNRTNKHQDAQTNKTWKIFITSNCIEWSGVFFLSHPFVLFDLTRIVPLL